MSENKNMENYSEERDCIDYDDYDEVMKYYCANKERIDKEIEELESTECEPLELTKTYKIKTNRLFREQIGTKKILYPEVDTLYERVRSRIVVWFKRSKREEDK